MSNFCDVVNAKFDNRSMVSGYTVGRQRIDKTSGRLTFEGCFGDIIQVAINLCRKSWDGVSPALSAERSIE